MEEDPPLIQTLHIPLPGTEGMPDKEVDRRTRVARVARKIAKPPPGMPVLG